MAPAPTAPPAPSRSGATPRRTPAPRASALGLAVLAGLAGPATALQDEPEPAAPSTAQPDAAPPPTDPPEDPDPVDEPTPEAPLDPAPSPATALLQGHLTLDHRYRDLGSGDTDNDLRGSLYLDLDDGRGWSARFHGAAFLDLESGDPSDLSFGVNDTYGSDLTGRLYQAWAQAGGVGDLAHVRAGRILMQATPELAWFDGLELRSEALTDSDLRLGLYGGVPVHPFESSPDGDALVGASAELRPWPGGRARLDYMRFEDESLLGGYDNDLWHLDLRQVLAGGVRASGSHGRLDGEPHDLRLALDWLGDAGLLRVSYYELLNARSEAAHELDPFFGTTLDLFPYRQVQLLGSAQLTEQLGLEGGLMARRVSDEGDVGDYNRDFERAHLSLFRSDLFGFEAALTGEAWEGDDDVIRTWGVDLERELGPDLELGLGSYFSLYKYDHLLGAERDEVRSTFLDLRYRASEATRLDLGYDFEHDAGFGDYHTVRIGLRWTF